MLRDGALVEMVYRPEEGRTLFCVGKEGAIRYETTLLEDGQRLAPYSPENNLLTNEVVLFPSEPAEYESDQALMVDLRGIRGHPNGMFMIVSEPTIGSCQSQFWIAPG